MWQADSDLSDQEETHSRNDLTFRQQFLHTFIKSESKWVLDVQLKNINLMAQFTTFLAEL